MIFVPMPRTVELLDMFQTALGQFFICIPVVSLRSSNSTIEELM
jgi:hypothetical protein